MAEYTPQKMAELHEQLARKAEDLSSKNPELAYIFDEFQSEFDYSAKMWGELESGILALAEKWWEQDMAAKYPEDVPNGTDCGIELLKLVEKNDAN